MYISLFIIKQMSRFNYIEKIFCQGEKGKERQETESLLISVIYYAG